MGVLHNRAICCGLNLYKHTICWINLGIHTVTLLGVLSSAAQLVLYYAPLRNVICQQLHILDSNVATNILFANKSLVVDYSW